MDVLEQLNHDVKDLEEMLKLKIASISEMEICNGLFKSISSANYASKKLKKLTELRDWIAQQRK